MPAESINGTTLFFTEAGSGMPLVLLHGFPLDSRVWSRQVEALSDRCRVIAPDLRGFGQSKNNDPFTVESLAADIHALLKRRGALPCVLAGLSMGGYVAMAFAHQHPRDLKGLILVDTRAEGDTAEGKQNRNRMIEQARTGGAKAIADLMMPKMVAEQTVRTQPETVRNLRNIMEACPSLTSEHALAAMRDREDYTDLLPSLAVPTLVVVGEQDAITGPPLAQAMVSQIPKARLEVVAGAGHMTPLEASDRVSDAIGQFMNDVKNAS